MAAIVAVQVADGARTRAQVAQAMFDYCARPCADGRFSVRSVARHMLGLYHGTRRARLWRRLLSDSARLARNDPRLLLEALDAAESGGSIMLAA